MKTRFQSKSSSRAQLMVPINKFSFAAYLVQVNRLFRLLPVVGSRKRNGTDNQTNNNHQIQNEN